MVSKSIYYKIYIKIKFKSFLSTSIKVLSNINMFFNIIYIFFKGECQFPDQWSGRWFQSGVNHYININSTSITTKGECVQNVSDKFLIEDR